MKLFLDTNVLLDHALVRHTGEPFEAKFILSWALENEVAMYISPGSFHTFVYVLQRHGLKNDELKKKLILYLRFLNISQTNKPCFIHCLESNFRDLEDGFQYYTALNEGCDYLLTNNVRDFTSLEKANLKIIKPSKFLTQVLKKQPGIDY